MEQNSPDQQDDGGEQYGTEVVIKSTKVYQYEHQIYHEGGESPDRHPGDDENDEDRANPDYQHQEEEEHPEEDPI